MLERLHLLPLDRVLKRVQRRHRQRFDPLDSQTTGPLFLAVTKLILHLIFDWDCSRWNLPTLVDIQNGFFFDHLSPEALITVLGPRARSLNQVGPVPFALLRRQIPVAFFKYSRKLLSLVVRHDFPILVVVGRGSH